jgi:hypothetical protein
MLHITLRHSFNIHEYVTEIRNKKSYTSFNHITASFTGLGTPYRSGFPTSARSPITTVGLFDEKKSYRNFVGFLSLEIFPRMD